MDGGTLRTGDFVAHFAGVGFWSRVSAKRELLGKRCLMRAAEIAARLAATAGLAGRSLRSAITRPRDDDPRLDDRSPFKGAIRMRRSRHGGQTRLSWRHGLRTINLGTNGFAGLRAPRLVNEGAGVS